MPAQSLTLLNERELFALIATGNQAAFAEVFYFYTSRMHPFILRMVRTEEVTEEIIQDVFISVWKNRQKLPDIENYSSYIFTIGINKTYSYLKSKAREARKLQEYGRIENDYSNNTLETIDLKQSNDLINDLINQLTPQKKLIYKLTREEGLSHDEVASQLNISKNTVKNHLVTTLKFLRENLQTSESVSLLLIAILIKINF